MQLQGTVLSQSASKISKAVPWTGGVSFFGKFICFDLCFIDFFLLNCEYTFFNLWTYQFCMVCLAERITAYK